MTCSECDRPVKSLGLCQMHYDAQRAERGPCEYPGCQRAQYRKRLCATHYNAQRADRIGPCQEEGCERTRYAQGWCAAHYRRVLKTGSPGGAIGTRDRPICRVPECDLPVHARGRCKAHWAEQIRAKCATCEDVEWIISGQIPERVAERVGYRGDKQGVDNLRLHLRAHGRDDLAEKLKVEL